MKRTTSLLTAAISMVAMLVFSNCKKEGPEGEYAQARSSISPGFGTFESSDRLDAIVGDLSQDSYSFSFDKPYPDAGITRTAYGADSYLAYADPQDLICPEPIRFRVKKMGIWKIPQFIQPTCPDMIIDIIKLGQIQELVAKADPAQFAGLKQIKLLSGGGLLATDKFNQQYAKMQLDQVDALTKDLNPEGYALFHAPGDFSGGFTRSSYGYADLNGRVFKPTGKSLKDILKPKLKGCFDPIILSTIRERLQKLDPAIYRSLTVTPLPENKSIGVLSFSY